MRTGPLQAVPNGEVAGADLSTADLFALLWDGLTAILGTAAAAALVRRAARGASDRCPELAELIVAREDLDHVWTVPATWHDQCDSPPAALCALADELRALLIELTGTVVVSHLGRIPQLRDRGILFVTEEEPP